MKPFSHILAWAITSLLMGGGCSKKNDEEVVTDEVNGGRGFGAHVRQMLQNAEDYNLPALSKTGPITRQADGLWHETKGGNIFSGAVVHEQDSIRWEEKYEKGVRVFVRAWNEDGSPVALHSWNADGSPAD
jgi:hypothetical protein